MSKQIFGIFLFQLGLKCSTQISFRLQYFFSSNSLTNYLAMMFAAAFGYYLSRSAQEANAGRHRNERGVDRDVEGRGGNGG